METYTVYILYSKTFDKYYIGQSSDVRKRITLHNDGRVKSTAPYVPWEIHWYCTKSWRSEASILEGELKNLNRTTIKAFIVKYPTEKH